MAEYPNLRHDHFMVKVPKVLKEAAPKFLGTDFYLNGTGAKVARDIYTFPKREACLMAMSYSYEVFPSKGVQKRHPLSTTTEPHEIPPVTIASSAIFNKRASAGTTIPAAPRYFRVAHGKMPEPLDSRCFQRFIANSNSIYCARKPR